MPKPEETKDCYVVIAEDDPTVQTLMGRALMGAGYPVVYASDGLMALALLQLNTHVKILISDENMPNLGGRQLIQRLRREEGIVELGIMVVSGAIGFREVSDLLSMGADRFLPKPVNPRQLVREVHSLQRQVDRRMTVTQAA